jgi:hypothetical protein
VGAIYEYTWKNCTHDPATGPGATCARCADAAYAEADAAGYRRGVEDAARLVAKRLVSTFGQRATEWAVTSVRDTLLPTTVTPEGVGGPPDCTCVEREGEPCPRAEYFRQPAPAGDFCWNCRSYHAQANMPDVPCSRRP